MTRHAILAAALLLAACGSGGEAGNNSADEGPAAAVIEQTPDNLQDDPTNSVVPVGRPVASIVASPVTAIPAAFRGRWGIGINDCDPKRDDTKGLMTVSADTLRFWESRAKLGAAQLEGPATLVADFAFSGEGQEWRQERARLVLQDGGRTLVRDDVEGGTIRYGRGPGSPA